MYTLQRLSDAALTEVSDFNGKEKLGEMSSKSASDNADRCNMYNVRTVHFIYVQYT
jgi:hypothetical protein